MYSEKNPEPACSHGSPKPKNHQVPRTVNKPYTKRLANYIYRDISYSPNYLILLLSSVLGLSILVAIGLSFTIPFQGCDAPYCKGVHMSPAYAKIHAFDSTHTNFASKYSLYLYREQGKDTMPVESQKFDLSGTPILFIPGNAGSYKQVRSIASEASNQYFGRHSINKPNLNSNNLDFFTADFNEDFTAFHGRTMLDQSEYLNDAVKFILSLYRTNDSKTVPTSVILLGHSMGGMVARVMLSLPNYLEDSVNTIITLSTPHNAAPTTFDGELLNVYKLTDDFWRNGYSNDEKSDSKLGIIAKKRLSDVSLISITGGILDTTLPTDYTTLTGLIPSDHGFAVSTTGIPGVWTPIDHLAIVWCDQLRKKLAETLLQIVDVNSPAQTYPLEKRMEILRSNLLPGFQKSTEILEIMNMNYKLPYKLKIDLKQLKHSTNQRFFELPKKISKRMEDSPPIHLFNIPKEDNFKFNFISSMKPSNIENIKEGLAPSILLCRTILKDANSISNHEFKEIFDYTTDITQQFAEVECMDVGRFVYLVPKSYSSTSDIYYALEIDSNILQSFNSIVLVESSADADYLGNDDFVLANLEFEASSSLKLGDSSLWKLITRSNEITVPAHRPNIVDIDVPSMKSSLLAYKLDIRYTKSKNERFSPFISQTVKGETKWHLCIDSDKIIISIISGDSPFTPFVVDDNSSHVKFKVYSDSLSSDQLMDIYISVDWFQSLKLLVIKYRLSVVGFPLCITVLIILLQFLHYIKYNTYPSYGESLVYICNYKIIGSLTLVFSFLSFLTSPSSPLGKLLELLDPVEKNDLKLMSKIEHTKVELNTTFMSIEEPSLWFYGTLILFISIGLNFLLYNIILVILKYSIKLSKCNWWNYLELPELRYFSCERKTVGILGLLALVSIYLPYQFAFMVCVLTQAFSTVNAFLATPSLNAYSTPFNYKGKNGDGVGKQNVENNNDRGRKSLNLVENFKNFNLSFTILLLWLVPVNVPVLIVWIHDISLKWKTPFSSHHNILAIFPVIALVQILNQGYMIPIPKRKVDIVTTKLLLGYFAVYSLLFGTRHLYFLHTLCNVLCFWFLILVVHDWGNGLLDKYKTKTLSLAKNESKLN